MSFFDKVGDKFSKLGNFIDDNKWQIAAVAAIGVTGGMALTGGLSTLTTGQAMLAGTALTMTGQMAAGENAEQAAERAEKKAEDNYNKNTNYFGINRLQNADEAGTQFASNALPRTSGSRQMATGVSATPQPKSLDDFIAQGGY